MNIIRPGDTVFLSLPIGHSGGIDVMEQFDKSLQHFIKTVKDANFTFTVNMASIGAPNSNPEVLFVLRPDPPKTCLCE